MKKIVEKTITETIRYCDICKKSVATKSCNGCGIDLCSNCVCLWDDTYSEDYPDKYCFKCTAIIRKFDNKKKQHQDKIDELDEEMKEEFNKRRLEFEREQKHL